MAKNKFEENQRVDFKKSGCYNVHNKSDGAKGENLRSFLGMQWSIERSGLHFF